MVEQLFAVFVVRVIALITESNSEEKYENMIKESELSQLRQFIRTILEHYNDLVLCTDTASPERMQLTKSKFIAALGEDNERLISFDKQSRRRSQEEPMDININNVTNNSVATNGDQRSSPHKLGIRIALDFTGLTASRETKVRFEDEREKEIDSAPKKDFNDNLNQEGALKAQVILELMIRAMTMHLLLLFV